MYHIKHHYFGSHKQINPTGIVPINNGPGKYKSETINVNIYIYIYIYIESFIYLIRSLLFSQILLILLLNPKMYKIVIYYI